MKKRTSVLLLAAALWALLAGCGIKAEAPASPAPVAEPEIQAPAVPEPAPEPEAPPEEPAPTEPDGIADSYVGAWRDDSRGTSGGRCFMEIACEDGENYSIDIWWGSSAAETSHWQYTGTYDETWEGIDYIGTRYVQEEAALEEATGLVYLDGNGTLLWEDTFEHRGDGLKFQREN